MKNEALIRLAREQFHKQLVDDFVLTIDANGIPSNADAGNKPSCAIAAGIANQLGALRHEKLKAQSAGKFFECAVSEFVEKVFPNLQHLRPGRWSVLNLGNQSETKTSAFAQYEHLSYLAKVLEKDARLSSMIGNDYMVAPDIVVSRELCDDEEINSRQIVVDADTSLMADLRKSNGGKPLLHASISAKWTMRSDRAQNSRTEALNLIRNRKGHLPHIVVVTGEPLPSRLASLALGTGDLDCIYHFALNELHEAVKEYSRAGREDILEQLESLIDGKRLKDISDLPLDLAC